MHWHVHAFQCHTLQAFPVELAGEAALLPLWCNYSFFLSLHLYHLTKVKATFGGRTHTAWHSIHTHHWNPTLGVMSTRGDRFTVFMLSSSWSLPPEVCCWPAPFYHSAISIVYVTCSSANCIFYSWGKSCLAHVPYFYYPLICCWRAKLTYSVSLLLWTDTWMFELTVIGYGVLRALAQEEHG